MEFLDPMIDPPDVDLESECDVCGAAAGSGGLCILCFPAPGEPVLMR